jgi:hypothetical protein
MHSVHTSTDKISVLDQEGHLYDSITLQPLEGGEDKYAVPKEGPVSKPKSEDEKLHDTLNTIRASGAVDPDSMVKFEQMFKQIASKSTPPPPSTPTTRSSTRER